MNIRTYEYIPNFIKISRLFQPSSQTTRAHEDIIISFPYEYGLLSKKWRFIFRYLTIYSTARVWPTATNVAYACNFEWHIGKGVEGNGSATSKGPMPKFVWNKREKKKIQEGELISRPRLKPVTFLIRSRRIKCLVHRILNYACNVNALPWKFASTWCLAVSKSLPTGSIVFQAQWRQHTQNNPVYRQYTRWFKYDRDKL